MRPRSENGGRVRFLVARLGVRATLMLGAALLLPASTLADFEPTGIFAGSVEPPAEPGVFAEEVQLGGVGGMSVNINGVGAVPAGTVYAAGYLDGELWISRYEPNGEGLDFAGAWQVPPTGTSYKQCGPGGPNCQARVETLAGQVDVDVDQTTGNVYVYNGLILEGGLMVLAEFSADGSKLITRFGEKAAGGKTTAETPSQIHRAQSVGAIAVNGDGEVYVFDLNGPDNFYHRVMVFKPQTPGNYENYVYAGQASDISAGFASVTSFPQRPTVDKLGNLYVAGEDYVEEYDPAQPSTPICSVKYTKGGITAITVNPDSGAVFLYSYKDKRVHQLSPCSGGTFVEAGSPIVVSPERDYLYGLAFDPKRQLSLSRPPGVLYGAAPGAVPGIGKGQPGRGSLGYIFASAEEVLPIVEAESASEVKQTTAQMHGTINPKGSTARYVFEYLTDAAYGEAGETFAGAGEAPIGGAEAGGGSEGIAVGAMLTGLTPDTGYHFRLIATSKCSQSEPEKVCEDAGVGGTFHTYAPEPAGLPNGRVYELISPAEKHGGQVLPADPTISSCGPIECKPGSAYRHFPMQAAPSGNAIVYEGTAFSESGTAVIENEYIARRDPNTGWTTTNLTPPLLQSKGGQGFKAFDAGLNEGVLEQISPALSPEAPADYANLYRQPTLTPLSVDPFLTTAPPSRQPGNGAGRFRVNYAGGSADLSRLFFEANDALVPEALDGGESKNNLYELSGGELHLVNFAPGDTETVLGAVFGSGQLLKSGNNNNFSFDFSNTISNDGSRVFWSSESGQVYVRIGGSETRKLEAPGKFLTASSDGSSVLLNDGCLYDVAVEACQDLTGGSGGFQGIAGQSDDLSHIYFVDTAVLTGEEENDQGDKAQAGQNNLYAWNEGVTRYIATLVSADNQSTGTWQAAPAARTAEASPAGRFLAFLSRTPLTGYDNTGPCESDHEGGFVEALCPEAFLYDSATGELHCASCNPSNARPLGWTVLRVIFEVPGSIDQPRYLTDSGRLYFDSEDSLVPADTNHGAEDVYQFEAPGTGTCVREEGCVSLVSAGRGGADSNFLAIDEDATNVFFTTRDRLLPVDKDELVDLYDAREAGGFAFESESPPSVCSGETCQPPPPSIPPQALPSSVLADSGNAKPKPKKCKKGQVKRGGKCVTKRSAKKAKRSNRGGSSRGGGK